MSFKSEKLSLNFKSFLLAFLNAFKIKNVDFQDSKTFKILKKFRGVHIILGLLPVNTKSDCK